MTGEQATLAVIDALEELGIPYMLTGSLASNLYGIVRSTHDADFVLQIEARQLAELKDALGRDYVLDPQVSFETVTGTTRHILKLRDGRFTVELFQLADDPHDQARFRRRVRKRVDDRLASVPTPEDVIIQKLRWARGGRHGQDAADARGVIAVQADKLDWAYINGWCDRHGTRALLDDVRASIPAG